MSAGAGCRTYVRCAVSLRLERMEEEKELFYLVGGGVLELKYIMGGRKNV